MFSPPLVFSSSSEWAFLENFSTKLENILFLVSLLRRFAEVTAVWVAGLFFIARLIFSCLEDPSFDGFPVDDNEESFFKVVFERPLRESELFVISASLSFSFICGWFALFSFFFFFGG